MAAGGSARTLLHSYTSNCHAKLHSSKVVVDRVRYSPHTEGVIRNGLRSQSATSPQFYCLLGCRGVLIC